MLRRTLAGLLCTTLVWWVPGSPSLGPVAAATPEPALGDAGTPIPITLAVASSADAAPILVRRGRAATVGRPAHAITPSRTVGPTVVADVVLEAYQLAALIAPKSCNLDVSLLAAIGQVESGNLAGYELDADHRPVTPVLGPVLDGSAGFAAIPDTDAGQWDGDKKWDRAVGPMQFIPSSWRLAGVDLDADGERNPQDIEDAAGAAMVYLCVGGTDLSTQDGLRRAVFAYNHSSSYVRLVLAWKSAFDAQGLELDLAEPPPLQLTAVQYDEVAKAVDVSTARTVKARAFKDDGSKQEDKGDKGGTDDGGTDDGNTDTGTEDADRPDGEDRGDKAPRPTAGPSTAPAAAPGPASPPGPSSAAPASSPARPAASGPAAAPASGPGQSAPTETGTKEPAKDAEPAPPAKDPEPGPGPKTDPTPDPTPGPTPDPTPSTPAEPECPTPSATPSASPGAAASPSAETPATETPAPGDTPAAGACETIPTESPSPTDPAPPVADAASTEPTP